MFNLFRINGLTGQQTRSTLAGWRLRLLAFPALIAIASAIGCLEIKAPERINVNSNRPARVDPGRVPHINTVEEGRYELDKAYQNIRYLEDRVAKLERDKDEARRERDDYKDRNKRDYDDDND